MHPGSTPLGLRRSPALNRAVFDIIEQLESRTMLSVTQNADGWSEITQPAGGQTWFVSNSVGQMSGGTEVYDGTAPDPVPGTSHGPFKKIASAKAKMADGHADWLLLRRGDSWNESIGTWNKHGAGAQDPMVISYYGVYDDPFFGTQVYGPGTNSTGTVSPFPETPQGLNLDPRPIVNSGLSDGITFSSGTGNMAVIGIQFFPKNTSDSSKTYDGTNSTGVTGIRAQVDASNFLVEDCLFDGFKDNVVVGNPDTPVDHFTIRRSEILDSYNHAGAHAQGLYASGSTDHLTIEENVFDHNGWQKATDKTVFNHDMYINTGATNTLIQRNVITRGSLRGTLLRAGGTVKDNLYDQNAVAIQVGNSASVVTGNVILEGVDLPSLASGVGIDVAFSIPSVDIENNIVAHDDSAYTYNLSGINLNGGTHNATVRNNIVYDWRRTLINGSSDNNGVIQDNILEDLDGYHPVVNESGSGNTTYGDGPEANDITGSAGNIYYDAGDPSRSFQEGSTRESFTTWEAHHSSDASSTYGTLKQFADPNRDMASYNASVGGSATFDAWISAQRSQTREGSVLYSPWYQATGGTNPPDYTAAAEIKHIQDGFGTSTALPTTQVVNIVATDPSASELGLDQGTFTLTRTGTAAQLLLPLSVNYDLGGSANLDADYSISPTSVVFPGITTGATTQSITVVVTPKADTVVEGDETVKFNIRAASNPLSPAYVSGNNPSAIITISDATTSVNVQATDSEASETGPVNGTFTLTRSGPTTSALSVNVEISGSATHPLLEDLTTTPPNPRDYNMPDIPAFLYYENLVVDGVPTTRVHVYGTVTFPVGASTVAIPVTPVTDALDEGDETVGLTLLPATDASYVGGVSAGATVTIFDGAAPTLPGGGGGGGGDTNPPPLGHGLFEAYINNQDNFVPNSVFTAETNLETIQSNIKSGAYGPVAFSQTDERPGFNFSGAPSHAGINPDHFTTLWTGQIQPQYSENYSLSLSLDADASAQIWVQDPDTASVDGSVGGWVKVADSGPNHRPADADDNAVVDTNDFTTMAANFNKTGQTWAQGDFTGDGKVNALDFNVLANAFGTPDPRSEPHSISGLVNFFEGGGRYNMVIEYSEKVSTASLRLIWSSPSRSKQEVPLDRLYASSAVAGQVVQSPALDSLFSQNAIKSEAMASVIE